MRKLALYTLCCVLLLTGFSSCENEISFNGTETQPMLTLNCFVTADSTILANLTVSKFFLNDASELKSVNNAKVLLYVNGIIRDTLENKTNGDYVSPYKPAFGEKIKLTAQAEGYETVVAEDEVSMPSSGYSVDTATEYKSVKPSYWSEYNYTTNSYENKLMGYSYEVVNHFRVHFKDPAGSANYYRLVVYQKTYSKGGYEEIIAHRDFDDVVFGNAIKVDNDKVENSSDNNPYSIFSDELIDGKDYALQFKFKDSYFKYIDPQQESVLKRVVSVNLQPISKAYYLYLKSFQKMEKGDGFMSEPVQVYSNVKNGVGILGCITNQTKEILFP